MKVAVGIAVNAGRILMGQRQKHDKFSPGFWEFPGGKIDGDETAEQALKREFIEELAVEVISMTSFERLDWEYPNRVVNLHFYLVKLASNDESQFELNAHDELKWFTLEEAKREKILPANEKILDLLLARGSVSLD